MTNVKFYTNDNIENDSDRSKIGFYTVEKKTKCKWIVTIKMLGRQEKIHQKISFFTIEKLGEI